MDYELTFEPHPGYLYARIRSDSIDRDTALRYLREIADKCTELGYRNLLLERDIPAVLGDADLFYTTKELVELVDGVRIALFNPHEDISSDLDFAITIGTNRGANFSKHSSLEAAENWLLASDPGPDA